MSEQVGEAAAVPMVEAGELFERFWNAMVRDEDWQTAYLGEEYGGCGCGNCSTCGIRYALSWTAALLSNPGLADHAEKLKAERPTRLPSTATTDPASAPGRDGLEES